MIIMELTKEQLFNLYLCGVVFDKKYGVSIEEFFDRDIEYILHANNIDELNKNLLEDIKNNETKN